MGANELKIGHRLSTWRKLSAIGVGLALVLALNLGARRTRANMINGGISFYGNVTPYLSDDGTGAVADSFLTAHSLVFGPSFTALGSTGSFAGIPENTPVTMYSPLDFNPPQLPMPFTSPLWQVTVGPTTFSFTLSTMTEPVDLANSLELSGAGIMSDGTPADFNTATWVATFTTSSTTFSWNASTSAGPVIPEPGSLGLMALGALGLRLRRR